MCVGFPDELCFVRQRGNDFQHTRKVNGRLAAQNHDAARALFQRGPRLRRQRKRIERCAGARVPAFGASDTKGAPKIATAQRHAKGGNQFEFIRDFDLRNEDAGFGAGVAKPAFTGEPVHTAAIRASPRPI